MLSLPSFSVCRKEKGMRWAAAFPAVWRLPQAPSSLLESSSHFPFRHAARLWAWEEGGMVSALVCCRTSCWGNQLRCICRGASQTLLPFIHPSRLEFVLIVPEMQNNFNLCFLGVASLRHVYFFAGNFCWRLPYQWHKTVNKIQCSQNQQCCALTNPQNLGRSTKRKYAFCDSSRFLYS